MRSNSPIPVSTRTNVRVETSERRLTAEEKSVKRERLTGLPAACFSSTRVFHCPHSEHLPDHLGEEKPQHWQRKIVLSLISFMVIARSSRTRRDKPNPCPRRSRAWTCYIA